MSIACSAGSRGDAVLLVAPNDGACGAAWACWACGAATSITMMKAAKPAFNVAARIGMSSEISCQLSVVDDESPIDVPLVLGLLVPVAGRLTAGN